MADTITQPVEADGVQAAGDIRIKECVIIRNDFAEIDVKAYIGELNIFEDVFKNGLYGNLLMIDASNLTQNFPIVGDEYIRLRLQTPGMTDEIYRTFKVYSITDRMMLRDTNTQSYILHFVSTEVFLDLLSPVYSTFEGKISDVVEKIWRQYLQTTRTGGEDTTALIINNPTENSVKFTSPGWSPMHCLNWLAGKALAEGFKSPNYLFFESNKAFYFLSIEAHINNAIATKNIYQEYIYVANNLTQRPEEVEYVKDVEKEYRKVEDMQLVSSFNNFKNVQNGYYANRVVTLDVLTKIYDTFDYDHVANYDDYKHLENISGKTNVAPFTNDVLRGPTSYVQFSPKHKFLYNDFRDNVGDIAEKVLTRRVSVVNELSNFKLIITVPGRMDAEVGSIVKFDYPDTSPRSQEDDSMPKFDTYYSGYYMITAIRHKITLLKHMMIIEMVKDSYNREAGT